MTLKKEHIFPCVTLAVYSLLTFIGALNHELWFDEGQAWCLVRDFDLTGFWENVQSEGHPLLWYVVLMPFAKAGAPCSVIPFISWFFSVLAVAVVLFRSPFSNVLKCAVVFSGGFLFYNSVISRPYCLVQFLLCVIAMIYPARKKRPVLYGALVALLCNTHVCMSGLVGVLGIFMIIDLFKDWKTNTKKMNTFNLLGLFIAGIGVILLILPTIFSISLNAGVADRTDINLRSALRTILGTFDNNSQNAIFAYFRFENIIAYLAMNTVSWLFVITLILLRHYKKTLPIITGFMVFYIFSTEILWIVVPNRAYCFVFVFVFALWIGINGKEEKPEKQLQIPKTDTKIITKIPEFVFKTDRNFEKSISVLLCVILFATTPVAAYEMFSDYFGNFAASKVPAEYMMKNFEEGTVFVMDEDMITQLSCYLPKDYFLFYCIQHNDFHKIKYHTHKELEEYDFQKVKDDLKQYEHLYFLKIEPSVTDNEANAEINGNIKYVYKFDERVSSLGSNYGRVLIYEFDLDDIT